MKKTVDVVIRFRSSLEETILLTGAKCQGCGVQPLGSGVWKVTGIPEEDADEMIRAAAYYQKLL